MHRNVSLMQEVHRCSGCRLNIWPLEQSVCVFFSLLAWSQLLQYGLHPSSESTLTCKNPECATSIFTIIRLTEEKWRIHSMRARIKNAYISFHSGQADTFYVGNSSLKYISYTPCFDSYYNRSTGDLISYFIH